jgi:uncharacterized Zn finger protein
MKTPGADPAAKLLSTMLDVLTAELSDPARFGRGRTYARQGAVSKLVVQPAVVTATVQGSRSEPYSVTVRTELAESGGPRRSALVPSKRDVSFQCSCPDWDTPCKHAIAVMVHLSQRVAYDPELLDTWRGVSTGKTETIGNRTPASANLASAEEVRALDDFFGAAPSIEVTRLGVAPAHHDGLDEPWMAMLRDALRVLSPPRRGSF